MTIMALFNYARRTLLTYKVSIVIYLNLIVFVSISLLYSSTISLCTPINSIISDKYIEQQQKYLATSGNSIFAIDKVSIPKYLSNRSQNVLNSRKLSKRAVTIIKLNSTTSRKPIYDDTPERTRELFPEQLQSTTNKKVNNKPKMTNTQQKPKLNFSNFFREETDNYPEEEIKLILKQTPNELKELFNVLNTALDPNMNLTERVAHHYNEKEGNYNEASEDEVYKEESVCRSVIRNIYPREANKNNLPVYVPNTQEFMQVIQAEICQFPNQECNYLQDNLPYGMSSSCQQKYAYKKLLYLDPLEKRMASDLFRYPSCCTCYVRHLPIDIRSSNNNSSSKLLANNKQNEYLFNNSQSSNDAILNNSSSNNNNHPPTDHLHDTDIIHHNTTLIMSKRQPKAILHETNNNNSAIIKQMTRYTTKPPEQPNKIISSTLIEDQIFSNSNSLANNSRVQKQTGVAKLLNSTHHTVILQEDKVYKPDSEYKRRK